MRQVCLDERTVIVEDAFRKLRLNSPAGGWFLALQDLSWCITKSNIPYIDLFISPHLKKISIYMPWLQRYSEVPRDILAAIISTISTLPTSTLQSLSVDVKCVTHVAYFKDFLSSVALRCGPSLTEFASPVPLSDAAINHLIQLPHLRIWHIEGPPPHYSTPSLPLIFPPLTELTLGEGAACGWLSLFERSQDGASTMQGVAPLSWVKDSLKSLDIKELSGHIINISFTSQIRLFQNLTHLWITAHCPDEDDDQRIFRLNDNDVTNLAVALPRLEFLSLGAPCPKNTCATTIACLLQISVHCVGLKELEFHFNSTRIVDDLENISKDPQLQELRLLPKCTLSCLYVDEIPLTLDEPGLEIVANGIIDIFPSLTCCVGKRRGWVEVSDGIRELRKLRGIEILPNSCFHWLR